VYCAPGKEYGDPVEPMRTYLTLLLVTVFAFGLQEDRKVGSQFDAAMVAAREALDAKKFDEARIQIDRALERDPGSDEAWRLRADWAEAVGDRDELVYALHRRHRLLVAQKASKDALQESRTRLEAADPLAAELLEFNASFVRKLLPLAEQYEKERRPHSAIRVHQEILSLDPERRESIDKIEVLSAAPDPSLAETAKPKDLLEGISDEWIRKHDLRHASWDNRAKLAKTNYVTLTDAGYEVLVRAAEAMEQMNAFYREFFRYGTPETGGSVPRIELHIFKTRDEYLKLGIGPPVEWSGGHFTGGSVETFIGPGGFEGMISTLFHEAAHQFVGLATTATGWLNEGLASYFEGSRILANGTVQTNMPAVHRLLPLASRMQTGWMRDVNDGIDPTNPSAASPSKAPTFKIIIENEYAWGPPWYAPTWGVVYFLYNYQDPVDGRFVYRSAFQEFINSSGGRVGKGAVSNFEKVVLANPSRPTKGVDFGASPDRVRLPRTIGDLDDVWKEYILRLRDEQMGRIEVSRPYLDWGRYAIRRREYEIAKEHFEKGLVATPRDIDLLVEFSDLLAERFKNRDRASKLLVEALRILEAEATPDEKRIDDLESKLASIDPGRRNFRKIREELRAAAASLVDRYLEEGLAMVAMDVSLRFGREFGFSEMFDRYATAARASGKSLSIWELAYNEVDLSGWDAMGNDVYEPYGGILRATLGEYAPGAYDYRALTLERVTSGDYSMEAEIRAEYGVSAFCGLVFGQKGPGTFHSLFYFPGQGLDEETGVDLKGFVDLTTFYDTNDFKVWRHNPVPTSATGWHRLRLDVTGSLVDVWFDEMPIVTHDFGNLDVLRGRFGLITGPGKAQFRNVRFLARDPLDPGAWIDRQIRMEKFRTPEGSVGGSWLGRVPPFPKVAAWLQEPRLSWGDRGPSPTLLVLWSPKQNDVVPLDAWLRDLEKRYADVGLSIVSICEPSEPAVVEEYLASHPFPGSVGIDFLHPWEGTFGETYETFGIGTVFNLPRLLLVDIDGKVVWEGDPGFELGKPWQPGVESYVDAPIDELIAKRRLEAVVEWRKKWRDGAPDAIAEPDVARLLDLLLAARDLPADGVPEVVKAHAMLEEIEVALDHLDVTIAKITEAGCEPAVPSLLAWGERMEKEVAPEMVESVREATRSRNQVFWRRFLGLAASARNGIEGREEIEARILLKKTETFPGTLIEAFRAGLEAALEAGDLGDVVRLIRAADRLPDLWLLRQYFRFDVEP